MQREKDFIIQETEINNAFDFIEKYIPANADSYYRNEAPNVLKDARSALFEILLSVDSRYSDIQEKTILKAS